MEDRGRNTVHPVRTLKIYFKKNIVYSVVKQKSSDNIEILNVNDSWKKYYFCIFVVMSAIHKVLLEQIRSPES